MRLLSIILQIKMYVKKHEKNEKQGNNTASKRFLTEFSF